MELEHSFTIPVPPQRAWEMLLDVEAVAPCMPGATVDSVTDEEIKGRIKVKVGPVTLTYAGSARFTERDAQARAVTLEASGRETRGAGTATATIRSVLRAEDGGQTQVLVHTHLAVTGRPAQLGRGMLTEVGGKIIDRFAANLAAQLASGQAPAPAAGNGTGPAARPGPAAPAAGAAAGPEAAPSPEAAPGPEAAAASIDALRLSTRIIASLRRAGIQTVGDLAARDEAALLVIPNVGPQTVRQIQQQLAERGIAARRGTQPAAPGAAQAGPAGYTPGAGQAAAPQQEPGAMQGAALTPGQAAGAGEAGSAAAPSARPAPSAGPLRPRPPDEDAIDLLNVAGLPVLKRILPAAGAAIALVVVVLVRSRRQRRQRLRR
jgi:carbon monoxide dehydrogenase subunit G